MSASKMSKWQEFQLVFHTAKNGHKFCSSTTRVAGFSWSLSFFIIAIFSSRRHHRQFQELKVNFNKLSTEMYRNKRTSKQSLCVTISIYIFSIVETVKMCTCFAIANTYAKHIGSSRSKSFYRKRNSSTCLLVCLCLLPFRKYFV